MATRRKKTTRKKTSRASQKPSEVENGPTLGPPPAEEEKPATEALTASEAPSDTRARVDPSTLPYEYRHPACQSTAFLLSARPQPGAPATAAIAYHTDGRPIRAESTARCDHCGGLLDLHTRHILLRVGFSE